MPIGCSLSVVLGRGGGGHGTSWDRPWSITFCRPTTPVALGRPFLGVLCWPPGFGSSPDGTRSCMTLSALFAPFLFLLMLLLPLLVRVLFLVLLFLFLALVAPQFEPPSCCPLAF